MEDNKNTKNYAEEKYDNEVLVEFNSLSINESLARVVITSFILDLDPTLEELADIKTAVSEAVTNAIIHGYENSIGKIRLYCALKSNELFVEVKDEGVGIEDIRKAMEAQYTTKPELERSGMGFPFMEIFMDSLKVFSEPGVGTTVQMRKRIGIAVT